MRETKKNKYIFHINIYVELAYLNFNWSHSFIPIHTNEVAHLTYHISATIWKWIAPVCTVFVKRMGGEMPDGAEGLCLLKYS